MEKTPPFGGLAPPPPAFPLEDFSRFLNLFSLHRKKMLIYPAGHPLLDQSLDQVAECSQRMFRKTDSISCVTARGKFFSGDPSLKTDGPPFREFAQCLWDRGIVLLILHHGLAREEITDFARLLMLKPEEITARGGAEQIFQEAGFRNLEIKPMDYSVFQVEETSDDVEDDTEFFNLGTEISPQVMWAKFVAALLEDPLFSETALIPFKAAISSEELADILNRLFPAGNTLPQEGIKKSMACLLGDVSEPERQENISHKLVVDMFEQFIQHLNSHLRHQFQQYLFFSEAKNLKGLERVLRGFSAVTLLEILDNVNRNNLTVSENILGLLEKLSQTRRQGKTKKFQILPDSDLKDKLQTLFREDVKEHFGSDNYRETLHALIKTTVPPIKIDEELKQLRSTLAPQQIEVQQSRVLLELFNQDVAMGDKASLRKKLAESIGFFLETGNFTSLVEMHRRLTTALENTEAENSPHYLELLDLFCSPEFMEEVLETLATWGKENLEDIRYLIRANGQAFVIPLLEQLAEESSRFLRRFIIDELIEIGRKGSPEAFFARLSDKRWYFVRNLVTILRALGDSSVVRELRRIAHHPHVKVRKEIIQSLFHFQDPLADAMLVQDLKGTDEERKLNAIALAEASSSPEIVERLLNLLREKGLGEMELEMKKQTVKSLGGIGNPKALPVLFEILHSTSLFNLKRLNILKQEILSHLSRFQSPEALKILGEFSNSRNRELALTAQEALKKNKGNR